MKQPTLLKTNSVSKKTASKVSSTTLEEPKGNHRENLCNEAARVIREVREGENKARRVTSDPKLVNSTCAATSVFEQGFISFLFINLLLLTGWLQKGKWGLFDLKEEVLGKICISSAFQCWPWCHVSGCSVKFLISHLIPNFSWKRKGRWGQGVRKAPVVLHQPTTQV